MPDPPDPRAARLFSRDPGAARRERPHSRSTMAQPKPDTEFPNVLRRQSSIALTAQPDPPGRPADSTKAVLGVDPGLERTGYAVVEPATGRLVDAGLIRTSTKATLAERLAEIDR